MQLGAFSISLSVKDLGVSRDFYEKLGFEATGGDEESYLIMRNREGTMIGLFQGMFDKNILTFNPGLPQSATSIDDRLVEFTDVREIREQLLRDGVDIVTDLDPDATGPASIVVVDPDGNPLLIDQHFPKPGSTSS